MAGIRRFEVGGAKHVSTRSRHTPRKRVSSKPRLLDSIMSVAGILAIRRLAPSAPGQKADEGKVAGVAKIGHDRHTRKRDHPNACLAARPLRYAAPYLLLKFGLLQPAAAPNSGSRPRCGQAQRHALDTRRRVRKRPTRTRAGRCCPVDQCRSRRHRADTLDQLWRRDGGEGSDHRPRSSHHCSGG